MCCTAAYQENRKCPSVAVILQMFISFSRCVQIQDIQKYNWVLIRIIALLFTIALCRSSLGSTQPSESIHVAAQKTVAYAQQYVSAVCITSMYPMN